jgi:hypothetical protein
MLFSNLRDTYHQTRTDKALESTRGQDTSIRMGECDKCRSGRSEGYVTAAGKRCWYSLCSSGLVESLADRWNTEPEAAHYPSI